MGATPAEAFIAPGVRHLAAGGGLVAPATLHARDLDVAALIAAVRDVVGRTRALGLRSSEMNAATDTVTTLGDLGPGTT